LGVTSLGQKPNFPGRATTAAKVAKSTVAMTEEQVQSATARGYATVMMGFDVLMLKNAATTAISWVG
jgi:hypothetical protein